MSAHSWFFWALASAFFAALTAVLAKAGLQGIDSDFATFIRTLVIALALSVFLGYAGKWQSLGTVAQVAPVDKFSLVLAALLAVAFLGERPSLREWAGLALVASGVLVLAWRR